MFVRKMNVYEHKEGERFIFHTSLKLFVMAYFVVDFFFLIEIYHPCFISIHMFNYNMKLYMSLSCLSINDSILTCILIIKSLYKHTEHSRYVVLRASFYRDAAMTVTVTCLINDRARK